eukprot:GHVU01116924.1.p1 GENE.GHVU01116924.1~~GHVU01116924.1.p1  ORF type:complete len:341 (-),score=32.93 GHVU01116924.1:226-1248(-)
MASRMDKVFDIEEYLGGGTYGSVYAARSKSTGKLVALKELKHELGGEGIPPTGLREIALLKELQHPNIVKLFGVHHGEGLSKSHKRGPDEARSARIFLEFEYSSMNLRQFMKRFEERRMPIDLVKKIIYQILLATTFCHTHRTVHRDIKPCNVLISFEKGEGSEKPVSPSARGADKGAPVENQRKKRRTGDPSPSVGPSEAATLTAEDCANATVKLADFGLARIYTVPLRPLTHEVVTLWYRAPEILLGMDRYSTAVDVFSIGSIMLELLYGRPLFSGESEVETLMKMFQLLGTPTVADWECVDKLPNFQKLWPRFPKRHDRFACLRANLEPLAQDLLER